MDNVVGGLVLGDEGHHLRLGKHGAHAGDGDILVVLQAHVAHLVQAGLHGPGHHLQKAAGARGALVVHHKVDHAAVLVQPDDLAVLAADVDDRPHRGVQVVGPSGVAGNLSDALVPLVDGGAAVAGGHHGVDVLPLQPRVGQCLLQGPLGPGGGPRAGGQDDPRHNVPVPVQNDHVRAGGAAVNARKIALAHLLLHPFLPVAADALGKGVQPGQQLAAAL